jgi:diketogulonate reductase-like aldo/keto reductase
MDIPKKTLQNGFSLPVYGIGTWHMGGIMTESHQNDAIEIQAIKDALDAGVTHIDTAEMYGNGHAEELIHDALQGRDRSKIFITSKVKPNHFKYDDVLSAAERSLKRLGTDYLDLYLLHMPNPDIDIKETMRAMDRLKQDGMIRNIGVSNFSLERYKLAQDATRNKIVVNQMLYNLNERFIEETKLLDYALKEDFLIVAYTPVHKGAYDADQLQILKQIAKKYGKSVTQIALNWITSQTNVVTISKTTSKEHLEENLGSFDFTMDEEDRKTLQSDFPHHRNGAFYDSALKYRLVSFGNSLFKRK